MDDFPPGYRRGLDVFISSGFNAYLMGSECLEEYRQVVISILKLPRWSERFSEEFVQEAVKSALRPALDHDRPEQAAEHLQRQSLAHNF